MARVWALPGGYATKDFFYGYLNFVLLRKRVPIILACNRSVPGTLTQSTWRHDRAYKGVTRTLRQLERYGLIARHAYGEVPPRVEYRLTELGRGLLLGMLPLWQWVIENAESFRSTRHM